MTGRAARPIHLRAAPLGWLSRRYALRALDRPFGTITLPAFWGAGAIDVGETHMEVRRQGWRGTLLVDDGEVMASAKVSGLFRRVLLVEGEGLALRLEPTGLLGSSYELSADGQRAGWVRRPSLWSRKAEAELPDWLAPELQAFVLCTVLWTWRQQAAAS